MTAPLRERLEERVIHYTQIVSLNGEFVEDDQATLAALTEALAALAEREKDAERLDWLDKEWLVTTGNIPVYYEDTNRIYVVCGADAKTLREAIDAAIKEGK